MSDGFSGSSTRGLDSLEKEIEYRLGQMRMDVFTKDFSPPGTAEVVSGQDVQRGIQPFEAPHDDSPARAPKGFVRGSAAGNADDQAEVDAMDVREQARSGKIKSPKEQFPMKKNLDQMIEKRMARGSTGGGSYKGHSYAIQTKGKAPFTWYRSEIDGAGGPTTAWVDSATQAGNDARKAIDTFEEM